MAVNSISQKILFYLQKNLPYSYNAKTLYRVFKGKIPETTIKVELSRLVKRNRILRETRGFYRAKITDDTLHLLEKPPTLLHGIVLVCETKQKLQNGGQGTPPQGYNGRVLSWFEANDFLFVENNNSFYRDLWYDDRRITVTFHLNGKIVISINSTSHPLSYPEFCKVLEFLNGFLHDWMPLDRKEIVLSEVGLAKDFKRLRLEGVSSISLKVFSNAWARVYYKEDVGATRFEVHVNADMSLEDACNVLSLLTGSVRNGSRVVDSFRDVV